MSKLPTRCEHLKDNGERCACEIGIQADGKCRHHSPLTAAEMAAARSRGGRTSTVEKHARPGLSEDELPPLESHEDAQARLDLISVAVLTNRIDKGTAQAAARAVEVWNKVEGDRLARGKLDQLEKVLGEKEKEISELRRQLARYELRAS